MRVGVFQTDPVLEEPPGPQPLKPDPDYAGMDDEEFFAFAEKVGRESRRRSLLHKAQEQAESAATKWHLASGHEQGEEWRQPTGAHDAYPRGWEVVWNGKRWRSLTPGNVWEPGVRGWREVAVPSDDGGESSPDWVPPTGVQDEYDVGSIVRHKGRTWINRTPSNVWEPGVHGWEEVQ